MSRLPALLLGLLLVLPGPLSAQDTERLYQEACDGGDMIACNVFGLMYETGDGVAQDFGRAASLYERACQGGALVGCSNLGLMYEAGAGVPLDSTQAIGFYRVACEGGEVLGCDRLGAATQATGPIRPLRYFKTGRVGDAETGEPLSDAIVEVESLDLQAISDASGRIELSGLSPGTHPLRAERLGYEVLEGELEVPGNPEFFVLMTRADVGDPTEPGRIEGRVTVANGQALADVEVAVLGQERARTLSNQQGRFTLRDVEPGLIDVRFARLGYAPRSVTLVVQPGRTVELAATMVVEPIELDPVQVTVRSSFLEQSGFYERAEGGWGTHFTPQDIELLATESVADVIRGRVPGVSIQYGAYGPAPEPGAPSTGPAGGTMARAVSRVLGRSCVLSIYVDGIEIPDVDLTLFPPQEIAAIEVYEGRLGTPPQYMANECGAILLWTRRAG